MIPTESMLPPHYVRGSPCTLVGLQLHEHEPAIEGRDSLVSHGCVLLQYMPKCVYVKFDDTVDTFMPPPSIGAPQPDVGASQSLSYDMRVVMAIEPKPRQWTFKSSKLKHGIAVSRTQIPLHFTRRARQNGGAWFHRSLDIPLAAFCGSEMVSMLRQFVSP